MAVQCAAPRLTKKYDLVPVAASDRAEVRVILS